MRLSRYFLPVLKDAPAEAEIVSHKLMLRAGMIQQLSAGIYNWLPLGLAVLKKVEQIVREEMNAAGAIEILMPTIQPADLWRESGRYEAYGKEMLRIRDRHERDMLFGPTNEENVTDIFRRHVKSYRQLPLNLYHIQWKFRDEVRPRFGVMRGREFLMKDAYSFDVDHDAARRGLRQHVPGLLAHLQAHGPDRDPDAGRDRPDRRQHEPRVPDPGARPARVRSTTTRLSSRSTSPTRTSTPETLKALYAAADEKHDPAACPLPAEQLRSGRGIEVGHIFHFGTKYSEAMGAKVMGPDGTEVPVERGSYGIGVSRLVGALIEAFHDDKGIVWPESVAPFRIGLVNLRPDDAATTAMAEDLYGRLQASGVEVLMDDRDERAGVKFATMELIGLPWQVTVGPRGVGEDRVELKSRATGETISSVAAGAGGALRRLMAFGRFERLVAWRYLRPTRGEGFISVIAGFALVGIALGVGTLIVVLAVMNGFRSELLGRVLGVNGHATVVSGPGGIADFDQLVARLQGAPGLVGRHALCRGAGDGQRQRRRRRRPGSRRPAGGSARRARSLPATSCRARWRGWQRRAPPRSARAWPSGWGCAWAGS